MTIKLAPPLIEDEDRRCVCEALKDTTISYGPVVEEFEQAVAGLFEMDKGVATVSGTAALHLGLLIVGVQPGDAVLMPTLTFAAPAHAARYVGAEPLLFDVDPIHRQLDVRRLEEWLWAECDRDGTSTVHRASGRRIGAVIPVDLLGHPCDTDSLKKVVEPFHIPIVEDAAQGFGARLRDRPLGASADVICMSFNANKTITTGGGGMLLSNNPDFIKEARFLANQAKVPGKEYIHEKVGFNYRLPTAPAALGLSQLQRLESIAADKQRIARRYQEGLDGIPGVRLPQQAPWAEELNWLYTVHLDEAEFGLSARAAMGALAEGDIETRPIFTPLHQAGAYADLNAHPCRNAEKLAATGLTLPSSISLTTEEIDYVIEGVLRVSSRLAS